MIGQRETIKQILEDYQWHCGTEFQKLYIPEYRTRINELRKKDDLVIETRRCKQHQHRGVMQEWILLPKDDKSAVPKESPHISQNIASSAKSEYCCLDKQIWGICFTKHETTPAKPTLF
jgi:hypothetical protein